MNSFFSSLFGAIIFYTTIKLPNSIPLSFEKIARWLPVIGILLGSLLSLADEVANLINIPIFTKNILIIGLWIYLTGGLHLDGVMDTADGLAVQNPEKRLEVMADSVTGAFGVMSGIMIIALKMGSLTEINQFRWFVLILACSWGRWGQLMAIAFYKYLKKEGKGAFLKENLAIPRDLIFGSLFILFLAIIQFWYLQPSWWLIALIQGGCLIISLLVGWWFNHQLGGHTGDTYGAVVEWSETLILCFLTTLTNNLI